MCSSLPWLRSLPLLALIIANNAFAAEGDLLKPRIVDWMSESIRAIAFNSDGTILAVAPKENDFWLADPATAKKTADIKALGGPSNFLFAGPKPDLLYSVEGFLVRLVNLKSGQDVATYGSSFGISGNGVLSGDGKTLAVCSVPGGLELLLADLGRSLSILPASDAPPNGEDWKTISVAFAADGKQAAGGRPHGKVYLWNIEGVKAKDTITIEAHAGAAEGLAFTPAGLVSLGRDGKVKTWNLADGKEISTHDFESPLERGWLLADGQVAAILRKPGAGEIQLHRLPTKTSEPAKLIGTINIADVFDGFPIRTREFVVPHLVLAPGGKYLAVAIQAGQEELTNARVGIYDVADIMPKMMVPQGPSNSTVADNSDSLPKTTPAPQPVPRAEQEARTWQTADGMFSVEAQLVSFANGLVKLKRADNGKVITIKITQLSADDQAFLKSKR